jgi:hypothetical protein
MLAGDVFAANRVEVKVNSEPIVDNTTCGKAGGMSFEWDSGSVITVGDRIKIDLDLFGTVNGVTHQVTLCRDIDLVFAESDPDAGGQFGWDPGDAGDAGILINDTRSVYVVVDSNSAIGPSIITNAVNVDGIYFHLWGNAGNRRLWLDVEGDAGATITVGPDAQDKFVIKFMDQRLDTYIWHDDDTLNGEDVGIASDDDDPTEMMNGPFTNLAAVVSNTFCINISAWDEGVTARGTYNANIDSDNDQFSFIPSNPQVAHNGSFTARTFARVACDKSDVGTIPMGAAQQAACLFDYETGLGYCPDHLGDHRLMFQNTNNYFPEDYTYTVTLTILVNGVGGDNGVYFNTNTIGFTTRNARALICDDVDDVADNQYAATAVDALAFATGNCVDNNRTRQVRMTYPANTGAIAVDHNFLWIDIPTIAYQTTGVNAVTSGDSVTITVDVTANNTAQDPCGGRNFAFTDTIPVGRFVSDCGQNFSVVFPYLTDVVDADGDATDWWSGLAVTNMGNLAGSADIYVYETDGDTAQVTVNMAPHSIQAWILGSSAGALYTLPGLTTSAGATLGNARSYIVVCSDFNVDGFALLGNPEYGYAQGYLPRTDQLPEECD